MAGNRFSVVTPSGGFSSGTGAEKTQLTVAAPANIGLIVTNVSVYLAGTNSTQAALEVITKRSTPATGTSTGAVTPQKLGTNPETVQSTAAYGYTVEPTAGAVLDRWFLNSVTFNPRELPYMREILVPGGGQVGVALNNSGTAVNAQTTMTCQE